MKILYVDDVPIEYDQISYRDDYLIYRIGRTLSGTKARVSCYNLPKWFIDGRSGSIRTSGHIFSFRSNLSLP